MAWLSGEGICAIVFAPARADGALVPVFGADNAVQMNTAQIDEKPSLPGHCLRRPGQLFVEAAATKNRRRLWLS